MSAIQISGKDFLVTGGANLIGSHIAEALLAEGAKRVVLFDSFYFGPAPHLESILANDRVELVRGDVLRLDQLMAAMKGIDGVFSMAALLAQPLSEDPLIGVRVNVEGFINTLDACRFVGAEKVVLASSIAVYGDHIEGLVAEDRPWGATTIAPAFATYGLTKRMGEQLGRLYATSHGVDFSAVRYSTVYGERQHARGVNTQIIPATYRSVSAGEAPVLLNGGKDAHDYVHASDAAAGALRAMSAGLKGEAYNIASGVSTTTGRVSELVIEAMGSTVKPVEKPDERAHRGTGQEELHIDISKARNELDWKPKVSIDDGIRRLVAWFATQDSV